MPLSSARARKPAASASDTRFEIVMVNRSLAAANAIRAGNSRRRAMSRIMGYTARAADARSEHRPSLAVRDEQSGNVGPITRYWQSGRREGAGPAPARDRPVL